MQGIGLEDELLPLEQRFLSTRKSLSEWLWNWRSREIKTWAGEIVGHPAPAEGRSRYYSTTQAAWAPPEKPLRPPSGPEFLAMHAVQFAGDTKGYCPVGPCGPPCGAVARENMKSVESSAT